MTNSFFQQMKEPPPFTLFLMRFCVNYLPYIDYLIPWLFIGSGLILGRVAIRINTRSDAYLP